MPKRQRKAGARQAPREQRTNPETARGPERRGWLLALVPALLAVVAFAPTLGNPFVDWDDLENFVNNRSFRGLGWAQIRWAWTTLHMGVYQPLSWIFLSAQSLISGLDPRGYHAASLLLYAADAVALYALTVVLLSRCRPEGWVGNPRVVQAASGLAVALYMVHPLRTEVVAWVSCQPYLLSVLFSLLSVLAYLQAHPDGQSSRIGWTVGAWFLLAAALLSKAVAVGLPAVLLVLDVYPLRRLGPGRWAGPSARRVLAEKVPFAALSVAFAGLAVLAREHAHTLARLEWGGIGSRIAQASYAVGFYPLKTVLPLGITAYYPLPDRVEWSDPRFPLGALLLVGVTAALVWLRNRRPGLLAAWICYLLILAPNSGLVRSGPQLVADRYSYLAMMGFVVLLAAGLAKLLRWAAVRRRIAVGVAVVSVGLIAGLTALSWQQCRTWRRTSALWRHALAQTANPPSEMYNFLGAALAQEESPEAALPYLIRAVQISPKYPEAHYNLGAVLFRQGRLEEAATQFGEAVRLRSDFRDALTGLGRTLYRLDQFDAAAARFSEVIRLSPDDADAHHYLGATRLRQGRLDEAAEQFNEALRLRPDHADALSDLGTVLAQQGRLSEAADHFAEALRLRPDHADAHYNYGVLLAQEGRLDEARSHFAQTLRTLPGHAGARRGLDAIAQRLGRPPLP